MLCDLHFVCAELRQEGKSWVALVPDTAADDTARQQSPSLDEVIRGVEILVNFSEASVHVPQQDEAERRSGGHHTYKVESFNVYTH